MFSDHHKRMFWGLLWPVAVRKLLWLHHGIMMVIYHGYDDWPIIVVCVYCGTILFCCGFDFQGIFHNCSNCKFIYRNKLNWSIWHKCITCYILHIFGPNKISIHFVYRFNKKTKLVNQTNKIYLIVIQSNQVYIFIIDKSNLFQFHILAK